MSIKLIKLDGEHVDIKINKEDYKLEKSIVELILVVGVAEIHRMIKQREKEGGL